jgi:hypothetical protein
MAMAVLTQRVSTRPIVLESRCAGRVPREWRHGIGPRRATRVAALFYSLIESAKLCGVEPRAYLGEAARQAIRCPGAVTLARDFK